MSCLWLAGLFRLSCAFLVVPLLEQDLLQKVGLDKVDFERSASWQMIFLSKWIIFRFHWSSGNPFSMMDHLKCCSQRIMAHWVGRKHILVASQPLWVCTICCELIPYSGRHPLNMLLNQTSSQRDPELDFRYHTQYACTMPHPVLRHCIDRRSWVGGPSPTQSAMLPSWAPGSELKSQTINLTCGCYGGCRVPVVSFP